MHKRLERILIIGAILVAAIYALINLWPTSSTPPQPAVNTDLTPKEPSSDIALDSRRVEAEVISNLVKIGSAELSFRGLKKRFGTFEELVQENLLSRKYSNGSLIQGHQYTLAAGGAHFACYADPVPGPRRHYFIDETLDLRYDDNGRASSSSPYLSYSKNEQTPKTTLSPTTTANPDAPAYSRPKK